MNRFHFLQQPTSGDQNLYRRREYRLSKPVMVQMVLVGQFLKLAQRSEISSLRSGIHSNVLPGRLVSLWSLVSCNMEQKDSFRSWSTSWRRNQGKIRTSPARTDCMSAPWTSWWTKFRSILRGPILDREARCVVYPGPARKRRGCNNQAFVKIQKRHVLNANIYRLCG